MGESEVLSFCPQPMLSPHTMVPFRIPPCSGREIRVGMACSRKYLLFYIWNFLAFALRDNRAFCKYLCPITGILKTTSRFALVKIEGDREKCTQCGACVKACPMNINIMEYVINGQRVLSTECIYCLTCTTVCPERILRGTFKMDIGGKEILKRK